MIPVSRAISQTASLQEPSATTLNQLAHVRSVMEYRLISDKLRRRPDDGEIYELAYAIRELYNLEQRLRRRWAFSPLPGLPSRIGNILSQRKPRV